MTRRPATVARETVDGVTRAVGGVGLQGKRQTKPLRPQGGQAIFLAVA
jgi:hypothetical protein